MQVRLLVLWWGFGPSPQLIYLLPQPLNLTPQLNSHIPALL
jgi:hypothetical protein